jgi:hypothetical protein
MAQIEFISEVPVLAEGDRPGRFGWARQPFFLYNPPVSGGPPRTRYSESDRYLIFSATHLIVFEVIDSGYLGYLGISVVNLKDNKRSTQSFVQPFNMSGWTLPANSETGNVKIREKKVNLDFVVMPKTPATPPGCRILRADIPRFGSKRSLRGEVVLSPPPQAQSLAVLSPWRREKAAYRSFRVSPWWAVEGVMQFGAAEIYFTRDNAWGIFDSTRSVRPKQDIRYWAGACGPATSDATGETHLAGFSVGYGSADSSCGTENGFFLDGVIHKLDQVTFHIPPTNWLEEWNFTSNDRRLEMAFTPAQERAEQRRMLFHSWNRRQVCGTFSGRVVLDSGDDFSFWNLTGFAERVKTKN